MRMCIVFVAVLLVTAVARPQPPTFRRTLDDLPDFLQSDKDGNFRKGGAVNCGPVAVSNGFMWLAGNGYPKLKPTGTSGKDSQIRLIKALAADDLMGTDEHGFTDLGRLLRGAEKYLTDAGYELARLEYQGLSPEPAERKRCRMASKPDLPWVRKAVTEPKTVVVVHMGWYRRPADRDDYVRTTGHYVTLAGYEDDALIVHDPAAYAGPKPGQDKLTVTPFPAGRLVSKHTAEPVPTTGYHQLTGPTLRKEGIVYLLESVVVISPR